MAHLKSFLETLARPPCFIHFRCQATFCSSTNVDKGSLFPWVSLRVQALATMSGSPEKRSLSSSSISDFILEDPPQIQLGKKNPRRSLSSPSLRRRSRPEIDIHQDYSHDPSPEPGNSEPRPVLMNDWIKMKIEVPKIYMGILYANLLAGLFTWLLLAGFMVLPVTFASLRSSRALNGIGKAGKAVFGAVQNIPLLGLAGACFGCGVIGISWIWWENRKNYIWLTDRVFL
jgi:hypothetical protein